LNATITDYLLIPKGTKGSNTLELLVTDHTEGFWVIQRTKRAFWSKILKEEVLLEKV
jgi:hypothetical protein